MSLFNFKDLITDTTKQKTFDFFVQKHYAIIGKPLAKLKQFDAIDFNQNIVVPYYNKGNFSNHHILIYLLKRAGKSDVYFSTFGLSNDALNLIHSAKEKDLINNVYALLDARLRNRKSDITAFAKKVVTQYRFAECHAKVIVVSNSKYSFTAVTSSNMTKNSRFEAGVIFTDKNIAEMYKSMIWN